MNFSLSLEGPRFGPIVGIQRLKNLRSRPKPKRMVALAETWRPRRSAAAHLLWHYFHKTSEEARDMRPASAKPRREGRT